MSLKGKSLLSIQDLSIEEINQIFDLTAELKAKQKRGEEHHLLKGKTLGMIFQKSSTRTRVSFETGIWQLGGMGLFLSSDDLQIGRGEPIQDTARTLSRYVDGIMIRTFSHNEVKDLAKYASIPVINGLTDLMHPCQALADIFTAIEHKGRNLKGRKLAYIGDGNNVANSLVQICAKVGMNITVATPYGHAPDRKIVKEALEVAAETGSKIILTSDIVEAATGADILYTDVWASMGQEAQKMARRETFNGYCVDKALLLKAKADAIVMHCLPAHRGEEITEEVIEGRQSVVFDEAENRLHVQKAIMALVMGGV